MSAERFMKLVEELNGFEYVIGFRDEVDHLLGGKGNTVWHTTMKDQKVKEMMVGVFDGVVWKDQLIKGTGAKKKTKDIPAGSTIKRIAEEAYLGQEEKWIKDRKGRLVEDAHPHLHYTKGFGDKAADISVKYGVTIGWSDLQDAEAGFHLRYAYEGKDVEMP